MSERKTIRLGDLEPDQRRFILALIQAQTAFDEECRRLGPEAHRAVIAERSRSLRLGGYVSTHDCEATK